MTPWRLAKALATLRDEVDIAYPNRNRLADGTIGDARHQAEKSDHNPVNGVVTAWDITTDTFTVGLAEWLRLKGLGGDLRVKYVIYRGRIASRTDNWAWRPYSGFSAHFDHIHLSVSPDPAQYDRTDPWHPFAVGAQAQTSTTPIGDDEMTPEQDERLKRIEKVLVALIAPRLPDHKDRDPKAVDLGDILTSLEKK